MGLLVRGIWIISLGRAGVVTCCRLAHRASNTLPKPHKASYDAFFLGALIGLSEDTGNAIVEPKPESLILSVSTYLPQFRINGHGGTSPGKETWTNLPSSLQSTPQPGHFLRLPHRGIPIQLRHIMESFRNIKRKIHRRSQSRPNNSRNALPFIKRKICRHALRKRSIIFLQHARDFDGIICHTLNDPANCSMCCGEDAGDGVGGFGGFGVAGDVGLESARVR